MKKLLAAAAMAFALSAGVASADTLQNAFGNTIVVAFPNGTNALYYFNEDGSFTGVAPGGSQMAGRWTLEGDQLCLAPPNGQAPTCRQIAIDKTVGDTWTQSAADGSEITVTLREGR